LLGTGIDDRARRVLIYHRLGESLYAIDDAPKIDVQHTLPVLVMVPRTAARRGAGIVHQYGNFAEGVICPVFEALDLFQLADIRRHAQHIGRAAFCEGCNIRHRLFEGISAKIGQANSQPHGGEPFRRCKADSAGGTGHDGDPAIG